MNIFIFHAVITMNIKYNDSMKNITLSSEARKRIAGNLLDASKNTTFYTNSSIDNEDDLYVISFDTDNNHKKSKSIKKIITIAASFAIIIVLSFTIKNTLFNSSVGNDVGNSDISVNNKDKVGEESKNINTEKDNSLSSTTSPENTFSDVVISEELKNNPYYIGMLSLHNYNIQLDIPVGQYTDNNYFIRNDIFGNESYSGSAFIDYRCDANSPHLIDIFAHNMKDQTMFGSLKNYKSKEYIDKYNIIMYNNEPYQVCAVYNTKAEGKVGFASGHTSIKTKEDFNKFITLVKDNSLFEIETMPEYGDKMINLNTPDYTNIEESNYFCVLAVRCEDIN